MTAVALLAAVLAGLAMCFASAVAVVADRVRLAAALFAPAWVVVSVAAVALAVVSQ